MGTRKVRITPVAHNYISAGKHCKRVKRNDSTWLLRLGNKKDPASTQLSCSRDMHPRSPESSHKSLLSLKLPSWKEHMLLERDAPGVWIFPTQTPDMQVSKPSDTSSLGDAEWTKDELHLLSSAQLKVHEQNKCHYKPLILGGGICDIALDNQNRGNHARNRKNKKTKTTIPLSLQR